MTGTDKADGGFREARREAEEQATFYSQKGMTRREALKKMGAGAVMLGAAGAMVESFVQSASASAPLAHSASASELTSALTEVKSAKKPLKMLTVGFGDAILWCDEMKNASKYWGKFYNVEPTHVDGGGTPAIQLSRLEDVVNEKWDFMAVTPIVSNTLTVPCKELIRRGVPVIQQVLSIGKPGEDIGYLTFIAENYVDVGKKLASYMFGLIGGVGTAIVTQGVAGTSNVIGRQQGVEQALKLYPKIDLLAVDYTNYSVTQQRTLWDAYVQKYPVINVAVTLTTGAGALEGTYAALKAAGRAGKTLIGANNADTNACIAVKKGILSATIRHSAVLLGMWAVIAGALHKSGLKIPKNLWLPDQLITDASTAESMIFLQENGVFLG